MKWSGLAVCVLMVVVFAVSLRWTFGVVVCRNDGKQGSSQDLVAGGGCVWYLKYLYSAQTGGGSGHEWILESRELHALWRPKCDWDVGGIEIVLPLWLPFTAVAIPTAILFRLDGRSARRARAGQCMKCGYDLAGIVIGAVCPECGTVRT